jgi:HTH-type transcriptional regulator/antitoxin HigA
MTETRVPAEVFPPGEFIKDEIEARGWSQADLAEILGRPVQMVNELIAGKRSVTPETALGLAEAFGTDAAFWMNLESSYQLWRAQRPDATVARRARVFSKGPIKEMVRRCWLTKTDSIEVLEQQVCTFYELGGIDETPQFAHAARRSTPYGEISPALCTWLFRCRQVARQQETAATFSEQRLKKALAGIPELLTEPEAASRLPDLLSEAGIRFVVVEPLAHTRVDGATFWLKANEPVVAVSARYDRIDWFWYTVAHELGHVENGDGTKEPAVDVDLVGTKASRDRPAGEQRADRFAENLLVHNAAMRKFVATVRPRYSKQRIVDFATEVGVHPGIVVGQLQHRGEITYAHSREMLVRIRDHITAAAPTDGWGCRPSTPA